MIIWVNLGKFNHYHRQIGQNFGQDLFLVILVNFKSHANNGISIIFFIINRSVWQNSFMSLIPVNKEVTFCPFFNFQGSKSRHQNIKLLSTERNILKGFVFILDFSKRKENSFGSLWMFVSANVAPTEPKVARMTKTI